MTPRYQLMQITFKASRSLSTSRWNKWNCPSVPLEGKRKEVFYHCNVIDRCIETIPEEQKAAEVAPGTPDPELWSGVQTGD